jgi:hypothetical protein
MNFNLRKRLQESRDSDSTLGAPFTQGQEERLQELIRAEVLMVLGAGPAEKIRHFIGADNLVSATANILCVSKECNL